MRCSWSTGNELMEKYHDTEWGVPVHNDRLLFEHLTLDVFQAGLSWLTVLKKRENFREALDNFSIEKIALYDERKTEELLTNEGIIRNRMKIEATIHNAGRVQSIQKEWGSFDAYIWSFTQGKSVQNTFRAMAEIPAKTILSDTLSKDLKKRGFKFTGTTIIYAFMQAVGIVNDHVVDCERHKELT